MRPITSYESYLISENGDIYSKKTFKKFYINIERFKKYKTRVQIGIKNKNGHKNFLIAGLLANTFLPNPDNKKEANHIDGNFYNNYVSNLEWLTHQENMDHAFKNGLVGQNDKGRRVLKIDKNTGEVLGEFKSIAEAARSIGLVSSCIDSVVSGRFKTSGGFIWRYKAQEEIEGEEWKDIILDKVNTGYQASSEGRIKNKDGTILKGGLKDGYITIGLYYLVNGEKIEKTKRAHTLVALAFLDNPDNKKEVDHIDTNRKNNKVSNLRWFTHQENCNNEITLRKKGKKIQQMDYEGNVLNTFDTIRSAKRYIKANYGVSDPKINDVCKGKYSTAGGFKWAYC